MTKVRVALPTHLRHLAGVGREVAVDVEGSPTVTRVLNALEALYPQLKGTIRDRGTGRRRAYMRYFADRSDISHESPDDPLPETVAAGAEALRVVGAIAGG